MNQIDAMLLIESFLFTGAKSKTEDETLSDGQPKHTDENALSKPSDPPAFEGTNIFIS